MEYQQGEGTMVANPPTHTPDTMDRGTRRDMAGMPGHPGYDHYPYERLTPTDVANNLRLQDQHITDLKYENRLLKDELYAVNTWRKKAQAILDANGLDVDEITRAMDATKEIFNGQRK